MDKDLARIFKKYETSHSVLKRKYLESKGWKLKPYVKSWLASIDAYPDSAKDYDILFEKDGYLLECFSNYIEITDKNNDNITYYSGKCNSIDFFEQLENNIMEK